MTGALWLRGRELPAKAALPRDYLVISLRRAIVSGRRRARLVRRSRRPGALRRGTLVRGPGERIHPGQPPAFLRRQREGIREGSHELRARQALAVEISG